MTTTLLCGNGYRPPFPYFGGKSRIASVVWERLGDVDNYVEPFFGSGAVLMLRPTSPRIETANDADGMVSNFWRALKYEPDLVAEYADWPVNENDLHARHAWLVSHKDNLQAKLEGDPDYYDAMVAGWWVWGIAQWIGSGWCSGSGPWQVVDGQLVHLGDAGRGGNRQLVHLGAGQGVNRKRVRLGGFADAGVAAPHFETCAEKTAYLLEYMRGLADRLRNVRVCCGDWLRVCKSPTTTYKHGLTGVFLDPPYSAEAKRYDTLYTHEDLEVAHRVREWAIAQGDNPLMRIALCGYDREHAHLMPDTWTAYAWKQAGGYSSQAKVYNDNCAHEVIWFSPHCLKQAGIIDAQQQPALMEIGS